jgi:hypothetical protein
MNNDVIIYWIIVPIIHMKIIIRNVWINIHKKLDMDAKVMVHQYTNCSTLSQNNYKLFWELQVKWTSLGNVFVPSLLSIFFKIFFQTQ